MDKEGVNFSLKAFDYLLRLDPSYMRVMFGMAMRYGLLGVIPDLSGLDSMTRSIWDMVKEEIDRLNEVPNEQSKSCDLH